MHFMEKKLFGMFFLYICTPVKIRDFNQKVLIFK